MKGKTMLIGTGDERYEVTLVKSRRCRVCVAEVLNGKAEVRIPFHATYAVGEAFIREKEQWLLRMLAKQHALPSTSGKFRLWGEDLAIEYNVSSRYGYELREGKAIVRGPEGKREEALKRIRRIETGKFVAEATARYAATMGLDLPAVEVRDSKRYLGKCYYKENRIRYSLNLSRFPVEAAEGVVVHELCHFKIHDHSRAFYDEVAKVLPDYAERRKMLKNY